MYENNQSREVSLRGQSGSFAEVYRNNRNRENQFSLPISIVRFAGKMGKLDLVVGTIESIHQSGK